MNELCLTCMFFFWFFQPSVQEATLDKSRGRMVRDYTVCSSGCTDTFTNKLTEILEVWMTSSKAAQSNL